MAGLQMRIMRPMNASGLQLCPDGHSDDIAQSCTKPQVVPLALQTRVGIGISPQQISPPRQSAALMHVAAASIAAPLLLLPLLRLPPLLVPPLLPLPV